MRRECIRGQQRDPHDRVDAEEANSRCDPGPGFQENVPCRARIGQAAGLRSEPRSSEKSHVETLSFAGWPSPRFGRSLAGTGAGSSPSWLWSLSVGAPQLPRRMGRRGLTARRRRPPRRSVRHLQPKRSRDIRTLTRLVSTMARSATSRPVSPAPCSAAQRSSAVRRSRRARHPDLSLLPVAGRLERVPGPRGRTGGLVQDRHAVRGHTRDGHRPRPAGHHRQQPVPVLHRGGHDLLVALAAGGRLLAAAHRPACGPGS